MAEEVFMQINATAHNRIQPIVLRPQPKPKVAIRSSKELNPPSSQYGSEWVQYAVPNVRAPQLRGSTFRGRQIDYNQNHLIRRWKAAYEHAKYNEDPRNKSLITRKIIKTYPEKFPHSWRA